MICISDPPPPLETPHPTHANGLSLCKIEKAMKGTFADSSQLNYKQALNVQLPIKSAFRLYIIFVSNTKTYMSYKWYVTRIFTRFVCHKGKCT